MTVKAQAIPSLSLNEFHLYIMSFKKKAIFSSNLITFLFDNFSTNTNIIETLLN